MKQLFLLFIISLAFNMPIEAQNKSSMDELSANFAAFQKMEQEKAKAQQRKQDSIRKDSIRRSNQRQKNNEKPIIKTARLETGETVIITTDDREHLESQNALMQSVNAPKYIQDDKDPIVRRNGKAEMSVSSYNAAVKSKRIKNTVPDMIKTQVDKQSGQKKTTQDEQSQTASQKPKKSQGTSTQKPKQSPRSK